MLAEMLAAGSGGSNLTIDNAEWETFSNSARTPITLSGLAGTPKAFFFSGVYSGNTIVITWFEADGNIGSWNDEKKTSIEITSVSNGSITFVVGTSVNVSWKGWIMY